MADSTKKKNYVKGSSKEVVFNDGNSLINLDLKIDGKLIGSNGPILPNEAGYVKITVNKLREPDQYGNTHSVTENDFKPKDKEGVKQAAAMPASSTSGQIRGGSKVQSSTDDMPF